MDCPENTIKACFLYLDRMEKEGKLVLKDGDVKKIIKDIENEFVSYMDSIEKYEEKIQKLPYPEIPQFHIITKYLISGANYIKEKGAISTTDETRKIVSMKTKHDIIADIEVFTIPRETEEELKNRSIESITLIDDNLAHFGTDSVSGNHFSVETNVVKHISSYLEQYHGDFNIFDKEEIEKLTNVIVGTALRFSKNEYISSYGNNPVDYKLLLDERTIDNIKEAVINISELKNTIEREYINIDDMLNHIKNESNREFRDFLISIPLLRSSRYGVLLDEFNSRYISDTNFSFLQGFKQAKNMQLDVKYIPVNSKFSFFHESGMRETSEIKLVTISTELEYLTDNLNKKDVKEIVPSEIILDVSKKTMSASYNFDESVPLVKECSEQSARKYFYNSNLSDGRIAIEVVDESDNSPKGSGATVMRNIAKNAKNIIIGTGTGITGTAKSIVGQIAYSGNIDNIEELERQYTELCGVFEIKSPYVRLLASLIKSDHETAMYFKNSVVSVAKQFKSKNGNNINNIFDSFTKNIIQKCSLIGMNVEDINIFDAVKNTKGIFLFLAKDKNINLGNMNGEQLVEHCLFASNSSFAKEVSGIQAGILTSLINSQSDTNIGITTRENLTGLKESVNFVDSLSYHNTSEIIFSEDENMAMEILEKNNLSAKIQKEYLYKNAEKNYTSQIYTFLTTNFEFFIEALKNKDAGSIRNLEMVSSIANQTKDGFIFNISKSGTSTKDDVVSLYAEYIKNNGKISENTLLKLKNNNQDNEETKEEASEENIKKEKKYLQDRQKYIKTHNLTEKDLLSNSMDAFKACVKVFQEEFLEKIAKASRTTESEIENDNKNKDNRETREEQISYEMNYYLPNELYNLYGDSTPLSAFVKFKDSYPYKKSDNSKMIFSVPTVFMKEKWKDFVREPVYHQTLLTNSDLKDIVDNFTSKGKEELLNKSIIENKEKVVVVSSRKIASIFNLYDIVAVASQRLEQDEQFVILSVSTPEIEGAVRNIDKDFLRLNNIGIKTVKSENIATEINKMNSKQLQYALVSNYTPIARGLSLAETDRTIITNPVTRKADGIQLLARGINPSKKILETNINLHDGGENIELSIKFGATAEKIDYFLNNASMLLDWDNGCLNMSDENSDLESFAYEVASDNSLCRIDRTYTDKINDELREANNVYKGFTSGRYADTKKTAFDDMLTITDAYQEKLQIQKDEHLELNIDSLHKAF